MVPSVVSYGALQDIPLSEEQRAENNTLLTQISLQRGVLGSALSCAAAMTTNRKQGGTQEQPTKAPS
jgi:hypothetical protein